MANLKDALVTKAGPVKDAAALHGSDIGWIYFSIPPVKIQVDLDSLHDGWVKITSPCPWKNTGKQGWFELSHLDTTGEQPTGEIRILMVLDAETHEVKSCTRI